MTDQPPAIDPVSLAAISAVYHDLQNYGRHEPASPATPIVLTRVIRTCSGCPTQFDAWDADGQYCYLRYRFGRGTVETASGAEYYDTDEQPVLVAAFDHGDQYDGVIELDEFARLAGISIQLAKPALEESS